MSQNKPSAHSTPLVADSKRKEALTQKLRQQIMNQLGKMSKINSVSKEAKYEWELVNEEETIKTSGVIRVLESRSNGRCLFESLAVQNAGRLFEDEAVCDFRNSIFSHIGKDYKRFEINIANEFMEWMLLNEIERKLLLEKMEKMTKLEKEAYVNDQCRKFFNKLKDDIGEWGGAETIAAFSHMHKTNVLQFVLPNRCYLTAYNEEYEHIVLISYEGNSHYNGLLSIEEKVVDKIASDLATYVADPANLEKHEDYEGIMEQISKMKIDM